jgi:hypothetical protein
MTKLINFIHSRNYCICRSRLQTHAIPGSKLPENHTKHLIPAGESFTRKFPQYLVTIQSNIRRGKNSVS